MATVAIVGAGAIGCTLGAWLAECGHAVRFGVRRPFDLLEVETPAGVLRHPAAVWLDPAEAEPVDWVILATKTYDTAGAAAWLDRATGPVTRIAVVQNGVEHRSRFPAIPSDRLVPVIADIPALRLAPGRAAQRRAGTMTVAADEAGAAFVALFSGTGLDVRQSEDWVSAAWRKLAVNCAGAVNALTLKPEGIAANPDAATLIRALVTECLVVGRAEGAILPDDLAEQVLEGYCRAVPDGINSIHADRLAGRQTEADARNGVIARLGAHHGIDAPCNRMADIILRLS